MLRNILKLLFILINFQIHALSWQTLLGIDFNFIDKVIYGLDNRVAIEKAPTFWQDRASNVGALIRSNKLKGAQALVSQNNGETNSLCRDEKFYREPVISECSGFLIAPDTLVTAGHCYRGMDYPYANDEQAVCNDFVWSFDYTEVEFDSKRRVNVKEVYRCKEVVKVEFDFASDFAVIKLERPVSGRVGLKTTDLSTQGSLTLIGHPGGLPKKISSGGNILKEEPGSNIIYGAINSFHGSSGSPVFNEAGEVLGLVISGKEDYYFDRKQFCQRINTCSFDGKSCAAGNDGFDGEGIFKISKVIEALSN